MLTKANRLKNTKEIERVFRKGKGFKRDFLFLKIMENNLGISRFAFVVSHKVAKKAVDRNRIKRRLGESIRKNIARIKIGFDLIFVAQPGSVGKNSQETEKNVEVILNKTGLII